MLVYINGVAVEGTPEEIGKILRIKPPDYFGIPLHFETCLHDFTMNSIAPTCRKCGAMYQPFSPTITVSQ